MKIPMSKEYKQYTDSLEEQLDAIYSVAKKAREKGLDPALVPEPEVAKDLAALVEGLVGPPGVADSIRELAEQVSREEISFKITEQIINGKFGKLDAREAAEQAIRTALAILTEGITAAPIQGIAKVEIKKNTDRTDYLAIYYAGPIRSAGGTEQALTIIVGDHIRRLLKLAPYKPTEDEIGRFIEEIRLFERSIARFQYHISDAELRRAIQNIPIEVTGTESDPVQVSSYRNLPRIETNNVRGGALRVVNDGIVGRAAKILTTIEKLGIDGWEWLGSLKEFSKKKKSGFMADVIAGRPIFSFPSRFGGFRLRYGRSRNTGLAAVGIHPATMFAVQSFLAAGTQLRLEGPGKGGIVVPVDTIEPPIVRLKTGSVVRVTLENFNSLEKMIDKILFLGDILIGFGDFLYTNKNLRPSGYSEEWWREELLSVIEQKFGGDTKTASNAAGLSVNRLETILADVFRNKPTFKEAVDISLALDIPFHPFFSFFWETLSLEEFLALRNWLLASETNSDGSNVLEIVGVNDKNVKGFLEKLCIPHDVVLKNLKIVGDDAQVFSFCLGLAVSNIDVDSSATVLEAIKKFTGVTFREKGVSFVGARMGRPEKAKHREMKPLVHTLFPVGLAGGSRRNLIDASKKVNIEVDLVSRRCVKCKTLGFKLKCDHCGSDTVLERICPQCGRNMDLDECPVCETSTRSYSKQQLVMRDLLTVACKNVGLPMLSLVKGVKGMTNETKTPEILEKGLLRVKHSLSVFKDGTIRFDATNAPLSHFNPKEIGVSVEQLKANGYLYDCEGRPLTSSDQICELKLQDVVIPRKCGTYFVRVANFLDELLEKVYGIPAYYNITKPSDLVGRLIIGLAPHTSVGIVGRIIGFTPLNVCYAHHMWHSAKRRDCDGDEDAVMLALDTVLNFSKVFLPSHIGGIMDAPILIIPVVNPLEVQRQAHEVDVAGKYPLAFYEKTWEQADPRKTSVIIDTIEDRLNTPAQFEGFKYTVPVSDINMGNPESVYKKFGKMTDKLHSQLILAEKIAAVDADVVARKVLTTHFVRDIAGNLRAFTTQQFRCKGCNKKFRRMPLMGKCTACKSDLILTVYRGGIEKYLPAATQLVKKYGLLDYYAQRLELVREELLTLFEGKKPRQISLSSFS
ncbi:MAG: DNA polymerase II large subunit [Candidatus Bathyarchaeota archaeon]|nr:DNA polymerase II large subunit [Candidatus Bathyarchaeota archaeon]